MNEGLKNNSGSLEKGLESAGGKESKDIQERLQRIRTMLVDRLAEAHYLKIPDELRPQVVPRLTPYFKEVSGQTVYWGVLITIESEDAETGSFEPEPWPYKNFSESCKLLKGLQIDSAGAQSGVTEEDIELFITRELKASVERYESRLAGQGGERAAAQRKELAVLRTLDSKDVLKLENTVELQDIRRRFDRAFRAMAEDLTTELDFDECTPSVSAHKFDDLYYIRGWASLKRTGPIRDRLMPSRIQVEVTYHWENGVEDLDLSPINLDHSGDARLEKQLNEQEARDFDIRNSIFMRAETMAREAHQRAMTVGHRNAGPEWSRRDLMRLWEKHHEDGWIIVHEKNLYVPVDRLAISHPFQLPEGYILYKDLATQSPVDRHESDDDFAAGLTVAEVNYGKSDFSGESGHGVDLNPGTMENLKAFPGSIDKLPAWYAENLRMAAELKGEIQEQRGKLDDLTRKHKKNNNDIALYQERLAGFQEELLNLRANKPELSHAAARKKYKRLDSSITHTLSMLDLLKHNVSLGEDVIKKSKDRLDILLVQRSDLQGRMKTFPDFIEEAHRQGRGGHVIDLELKGRDSESKE